MCRRGRRADERKPAAPRQTATGKPLKLNAFSSAWRGNPVHSNIGDKFAFPNFYLVETSDFNDLRTKNLENEMTSPFANEWPEPLADAEIESLPPRISSMNCFEMFSAPLCLDGATLDALLPLAHRRPMATTTLDLRGLNCPLPALKTRKALARLRPGDFLQVRCTDPLSAIDIPNLIRETGDHVEIAEQAERDLVFLIEKLGGSAA